MNSQYQMRDNNKKVAKGQFFRTSLKSRQDLAFFKPREEASQKDIKMRETLNRPDYKKFIAQTTKNQPAPVNSFFRSQESSKQPYVSTTIFTNKSADKRTGSKMHYSPSHDKKKPYNENTKPQQNEYQRLHDKLSFLQSKISSMKVDLQKRKQEKKRYFEKQMKERKDLLEGDRVRRDKEKKQDVLKQMVTQVSYEKKLKTFTFDPYSPRHNIYYVSEILRAYNQENSIVREHLINSMQLLKVMSRSWVPSQAEVNIRAVKLAKKPEYQDKKTVVLDLDQTLIHCNQNSNMPCDVKLPIKFPTGQVIEAGINIRPYATELLRNLSKNFQVIVFTASHSCYANVVVNYLDPDNKYVSYRLFRQHCYQSRQNVYIKDLRILNRNLSQMILVDNAAYSYVFQVDNGIPIIPYYEGKIDFQLKALQNYLQTLIFCKDVREINRSTFKLSRYHEFDSPESLVKALYHQDHQ